MYRIRFHGRGGQGMKTASRVLGTAFFLEGFQVQDAPRYGAERRGAPIFAYVRADTRPIQERGIIADPDLVIVADDTLLPVPAAGVLSGLSERSVLLINSSVSASVWEQRLASAAHIVSFDAVPGAQPDRELAPVGAVCAAAAARLLGVISLSSLHQAIKEELAELAPSLIDTNLHAAQTAWNAVATHAGIVKEGEVPSARDYVAPAWIALEAETVSRSAPVIHAAANSRLAQTGLWRTMRPVINYALCKHCWWVCSTFCPDGAITVSAQGIPEIDYEHCKGCMVCVAQCPPHAIDAVPEVTATAEANARP